MNEPTPKNYSLYLLLGKMKFLRLMSDVLYICQKSFMPLVQPVVSHQRSDGGLFRVNKFLVVTGEFYTERLLSRSGLNCLKSTNCYAAWYSHTYATQVFEGGLSLFIWWLPGRRFGDLYDKDCVVPTTATRSSPDWVNIKSTAFSSTPFFSPWQNILKTGEEAECRLVDIKSGRIWISWRRPSG